GQGVAVGVLLNHLNVQGVIDEQSRIVTAQGGGQILGVVAEDAHGVSHGRHTQGPVGAHEALNGWVVTDGHQQHLRSLQRGDGGAGVEGVVAAAGDHAVGVAVVDVALGPVAVNV